MSTRRKVITAVVGITLAIFLAHVALSAFLRNGYYDGGRCACGHSVFIRIEGDGYFKYSPGHEMPEHRSFALRPTGRNEWEMLALAQPDGFLSFRKEGEVVAQLRLKDGVLYELWAGARNWTRYPRVYIPWRVWRGRLLEKWNEWAANGLGF